MPLIWVGGNKDRQIQETLSRRLVESLGLRLSTEIINPYLALRNTWAYSMAYPYLNRSLDRSCLGPNPFPTWIQNRLSSFSHSILTATGSLRLYLHARTVAMAKCTSRGSLCLKPLLLKRVTCRLRADMLFITDAPKSQRVFEYDLHVTSVHTLIVYFAPKTFIYTAVPCPRHFLVWALVFLYCLQCLLFPLSKS